MPNLDLYVASSLQINSETDFVARNEQFQALASRLAKTALATLPSPSASNNNNSGPTGVSPISDADFAAWRDGTQLPGGDSLGAPCTVGASLVDLVARIRENILARRAVKLAVPGGLVAAYTHNSVAPGMGTIGVLVGLSPKDASKPLVPGVTPGYAALTDIARKVAMHVAAAKPSYLNKESVPSQALEKERQFLTEQAAGSGKPANIIAKMVEGRLSKYFGDFVLLEQPYILAEDGGKVGKWVEASAKAAGAPPVTVSAFAHFILGDGVAPAAEGQD